MVRSEAKVDMSGLTSALLYHSFIIITYGLKKSFYLSKLIKGDLTAHLSLHILLSFMAAQIRYQCTLEIRSLACRVDNK